MSEITSPIMLDDTGQDLVTEAQNIVTKLQALINAVKPTAADIPLAAISGMTADDVQEGVEELNSNLSNLKGVSIDDKTLTDLGQMVISQGCFSYYCQGTMTGTLTKNDSSYIGFGLFFYHKANQIPCYTLYCIGSSKAYMGRLAKSGNDYVIDMVKVSTYTNVN